MLERDVEQIRDAVYAKVRRRIPVVMVVRSGKGDKERQTLLPDRVKDDLVAHLAHVRELYEQDRADGVDGVYLPDALARKCPNAGTQWEWQWLFPSKSLSVDPRTKTVRRHHVRPNTFQKLEKGYDIRTIQELLGHANLQTTMIYTHVAKKNVPGVRSPLDR